MVVLLLSLQVTYRNVELDDVFVGVVWKFMEWKH